MRVSLLTGAYQTRSVIASAQASINLYGEINPQDSEQPTTFYPTPGKVLLSAPPTPGRGRGLYVDTLRQLYAVIGANVYAVSSSWGFTKIGSITAGTTPVSIADNETVNFLVDGTDAGFTWDVGATTSASFANVADANYAGSTRIDFLNTYFLFTKPDSSTFYTTLSNVTTFDPLYFANVTGQPTELQAPAALHGIVWLIGKTASEIWFDSGDTNILPFQRMPDQVLHQGCAAKYSIARLSGVDDTQVMLYWLGQNEDGAYFVVQAQGYTVRRVSTNAIEDQFRQYATVEDAIGYTYQQDGHSFYILTFPAADATWVYDATTQQWHQRTWLDGNGIRHRDRAMCAAFAYGKTVCLDWENGNLYELSLESYTDNGDPVERVRSFPHLVSGLNRVLYTHFIADMDPGNDTSGIAQGDSQLLVSLRWSDDRGHSYGNPVTRTLGAAGQFDTSLMWPNLGMARDRVFELSWSSPVKTALNGAYVDPIPLAT